MKAFASLLVLGLTMLSARAELTVASLHPVLTDVAQQIGGDKVTVIGLLKVGDDPHDYAPTSGDIRKMADATLILASGKGIEPYLTKLQDSLQPSQTIYDVGREIPSITISHDSSLFVCCPHHSEGSLDPHWWHSAKNMQRAAKVLSKAFATADPPNKAIYTTNAKTYSKRLETLHQWAKKEIAKIPRSDRTLATAHAAYTYFCKDYGFKSMPVQGLTKETEPTSKYLATTIALIKDNGVNAVFPEALANPKVLKEMVRGTGAKIGGRLFADFTGDAKNSTFEAMFRHNVTTIVQGLTVAGR